MNGPILTTRHAEYLNQLVQQLIDPRLYLLCNYEPTIGHAISEDGRYLLNIQDLYKFAIDSCGIIKQYYDFLPKDEAWTECTNWLILQSKINHFRTVFDHNTNENDGRLSAEAKEAYMNWVLSSIGKPDPETLDDYKQLNEKLREMAEELRCCFESFIRCVAKNPNRDQVVRQWIDKTLYWYSNNTKTNIYKGHLIENYTARAAACNMNIYHPRFIEYRGKNVRDWIANLQIHPIKSEIRQLEREIDANRRILAGQNLRSPLSPAYAAEFRRTLEEKERKLSELKSELDRAQTVHSKELENQFYRNLERQLKETVEYLDQEGEAYTLLPQDLIQADIDRVFGAVPIPDHRVKNRNW